MKKSRRESVRASMRSRGLVVLLPMFVSSVAHADRVPEPARVVPCTIRAELQPVVRGNSVAFKVVLTNSGTKTAKVTLAAPCSAYFGVSGEPRRAVSAVAVPRGARANGDRGREEELPARHGEDRWRREHVSCAAAGRLDAVPGERDARPRAARGVQWREGAHREGCEDGRAAPREADRPHRGAERSAAGAATADDEEAASSSAQLPAVRDRLPGLDAVDEEGREWLPVVLVREARAALLTEDDDRVDLDVVVVVDDR